jgi:hypothetical protein
MRACADRRTGMKTLESGRNILYPKRRLAELEFTE